jgi:hypothetical protein
VVFCFGFFRIGSHLEGDVLVVNRCQLCDGLLHVEFVLFCFELSFDCLYRVNHAESWKYVCFLHISDTRCPVSDIRSTLIWSLLVFVSLQWPLFPVPVSCLCVCFRFARLVICDRHLLPCISCSLFPHILFTTSDSNDDDAWSCACAGSCHLSRPSRPPRFLPEEEYVTAETRVF